MSMLTHQVKKLLEFKNQILANISSQELNQQIKQLEPNNQLCYLVLNMIFNVKIAEEIFENFNFENTSILHSFQTKKWLLNNINMVHQQYLPLVSEFIKDYDEFLNHFSLYSVQIFTNELDNTSRDGQFIKNLPEIYQNNITIAQEKLKLLNQTVFQIKLQSLQKYLELHRYSNYHYNLFSIQVAVNSIDGMFLQSCSVQFVLDILNENAYDILKFIDYVVQQDEQLKLIYSPQKNLNDFVSSILDYNLLEVFLNICIELTFAPQILYQYCDITSSIFYSKQQLQKLLKISIQNSEEKLEAIDSSSRQSNNDENLAVMNYSESAHIISKETNQIELEISDAKVQAKTRIESIPQDLFASTIVSPGYLQSNLEQTIMIIQNDYHEQTPDINPEVTETSNEEPNIMGETTMIHKDHLQQKMCFPKNSRQFTCNTIPKQPPVQILTNDTQIVFFDAITDYIPDDYLSTMETSKRDELSIDTSISGKLFRSLCKDIRPIQIDLKLKEHIIIKARTIGSIYVEKAPKQVIYNLDCCQRCGKQTYIQLQQLKSTHPQLCQPQFQLVETSEDPLFQENISASVYCPTNQKYYCVDCAFGYRKFLFFGASLINSLQLTFEEMCGWQLSQSFSFFDMPVVNYDCCSQIMQKKMKISILLRTALKSNRAVIYGCPKLNYQLLKNSVYLNTYEHVLLDDMFSMQEISSLIVKNVLTSTIHLRFLKAKIVQFRDLYAEQFERYNYINKYSLNVTLQRMLTDKFIQIQSLTSFAERLYISFRHVLLHQNECKTCQLIKMTCLGCQKPLNLTWSFDNLLIILTGKSSNVFLCTVCLNFFHVRCLKNGMCKDCNVSYAQFKIGVQ